MQTRFGSGYPRKASNRWPHPVKKFLSIEVQNHCIFLQSIDTNIGKDSQESTSSVLVRHQVVFWGSWRFFKDFALWMKQDFHYSASLFVILVSFLFYTQEHGANIRRRTFGLDIYQASKQCRGAKLQPLSVWMKTVIKRKVVFLKKHWRPLKSFVVISSVSRGIFGKLYRRPTVKVAAVHI